MVSTTSFGFTKKYIPQKRYFLLGYKETQWVVKVMPCRSVLIQTLLIAAGGVVAMENPQNSLISLHDRWVWLVNTLLRFNIQVIGVQTSEFGFRICV